MLTEEMLRNLLRDNPGITSMEHLLNCLKERSERSKTTKLWSDTPIKGLFIMTAFVRGAHEQDFPLQLAAVKAMLPYFAAAGCHNYLRYGSFYIHHMESLPIECLAALKNDCGLRLIPGFNNSIFTDQFIESTYMRLGHGPGGATGLAVNHVQMTKWALSFAICGEVCSSLHSMSENEPPTAKVHKEESTKRIAADKKDRESIQRSLALGIDPLDPDQHPNGKLLNIATGELAHEDVNAHNALEVGQTMVKCFRKSWPSGFYDKLSKPIVTMNDKKKHTCSTWCQYVVRPGNDLCENYWADVKQPTSAHRCMSEHRACCLPPGTFRLSRNDASIQKINPENRPPNYNTRTIGPCC